MRVDINVVERGGITPVGCAFDAKYVAGLQRDIVDGVARGVIAVGPARRQCGIGCPSGELLAIHFEGEVRRAPLEIEVLHDDIEVA